MSGALSTKAIDALAAAAQKEFDAGRFEKAAELFEDLYRRAASETGALYNAARARHKAAHWQKALELYREFLSLGGHKDSVIAKVNGYIAEAENTQSEGLAAEAQGELDAGHAAAAMELWGKARAIRPDRPAWLLREGRAMQLANRPEDALSRFDQYLALDPAAASERELCQIWRAELVKAHGVRLGLVKPEAPSKAGAYTVLALGGAAMLGGGAVVGLAHSDGAKLQSQLDKTDSSGKINGISRDAAQAEADRIDRQYLLGWSGVGVGAAATALGAWMAVRTPASTAYLIGWPGGALLTARF